MVEVYQFHTILILLFAYARSSFAASQNNTFFSATISSLASIQSFGSSTNALNK